MQDFRKLFSRVHKRPEMYGLDRRYAIIVAFILGCDAATDYKLLAGLDDWLGEPSIAWPAQIIDRRFPEARTIPGARHEFDAAENILLIDDLFSTLDGFLGEVGDRGSDPTRQAE